MKNNLVITPQINRTRKLLLILPLLLLPILTFAFYKYHAGTANDKNGVMNHQGLNTSLPGAQFDKHEKPKDKMSFYAQAKQDSAKLQSNGNNLVTQQFGTKPQATATNLNAAVSNPYADPNVNRINQKLAAINKQINQPQAQDRTSANMMAGNPQPNKAFSTQVSKLDMMMKSMNNNQGNDPEMKQLGKMLEQIQAIQNPGQARANTKHAVTNDSIFKAIPAIVEGNQKVVQGGAVKLQIQDTIRIKGVVIPKGTLIYGNASITNQRLLLELKNIRLGNAIIPVDLSVYSMDGMPGIPAPEAELSGAAGNGADNALESMQFLSMDQSLATQAAAGGIQAAKGLFSKKVKRIKIKLKGGYPILLHNNKP